MTGGRLARIDSTFALRRFLSTMIVAGLILPIGAMALGPAPGGKSLGTSAPPPSGASSANATAAAPPTMTMQIMQVLLQLVQWLVQHMPALNGGPPATTVSVTPSPASTTPA